MTLPRLITTAALLASLPAAAKQLTLKEAIALAERQTPQARIAAEAVTAADETTSSARALRYPDLRADANVLFWSSPFELMFGPQPFTVRDAITSTITVTASEPLTGQLAIHELVRSDDAAAHVAGADAQTTRLDAGARAAEAYLRLLEARALADVAGQQLSGVEAELTRAQSLEQAGVLGHVDVLRLQSAREGARAEKLRAEAGVITQGRALSLALGLSPDEPIDAVDDFGADLPAPPYDEKTGVERALAARPELASASAKVDQAERGVKLAYAPMIPDIRAVASYQHTEGSPFQQKDAFYAGVTLSWDIWDWGHTVGNANAAKAHRSQAEIGVGMAADQVRFDVAARAVNAKTAFDTLDVSKAELTAAEEAYRIQTVRFQAGAATTSDVLDEETQVARARADAARARYEYEIALANLSRAVGDTP
jgi:outer membrane protein TolC